MNNKYRSIDLSELELENAEPLSVIDSVIQSRCTNRQSRRNAMKALGKIENRDYYFNKKQRQESKELRVQYQQLLDDRVKECRTQVTDGLIDNWKKSTALAALTLKRVYNWNNNRVGKFIEKCNDLHIQMMDDGSWDDILKTLSEECDIELEIEKGD